MSWPWSSAPLDLLHKLQNQMYSSYEQKYRFVQNRVELDHQRRLCSQSGIATLERPGGMFGGGVRRLRGGRWWLR